MLIRTLNNARNRAMMTHGIYNCTQLEAKQAIQKSLLLIQSIEGINRWNQQVKNLSIKNKIEPSLIFTRITSIDTYVKQIL